MVLLVLLIDGVIQTEGKCIRDKVIMTSQNSTDRPVCERRGYFVRFFGFARGAGGELSIARSSAAVRFSASSRGNRSSASASRLLGVRCFALDSFLVMA